MFVRKYFSSLILVFLIGILVLFYTLEVVYFLTIFKLWCLLCTLFFNMFHIDVGTVL